eukprot:149071-Chlamydomonas_euryale.AAC.1
MLWRSVPPLPSLHPRNPHCACHAVPYVQVHESDAPLTEPVEPHLHADERAARRAEFDRAVAAKQLLKEVWARARARAFCPLRRDVDGGGGGGGSARRGSVRDRVGHEGVEGDPAAAAHTADHACAMARTVHTADP